ncbi:MAG: sulfotransferase family protein [Gemmatimonadota bacterium]
MSLRVIGAGLGRTGTASLKVALEQLGVGRCYHMGEVLADPSRIDHWLDAANGSSDWDTTFDSYSAAVDYPACTFWRELADLYPEGKVILTVRDANSWFESTNATIMSPKFNAYIEPSPFGELVRRTIWDTLDGRMGDRDFMVSYFERRNEEIQAALPAQRLLVYEVSEEWEPLCDFLELPVPDTPFPRINTREETEELLDKMISGGEGGLDEEAMAEAADDLFGDT